eukprot:TRINITY_DN1285_c1_g2_i2.p3 TRINITY_DN1285_c1_g2~~TRINITY_DN1285_c1_g2_i2.p3  ORF type:complete len:126 (+),score=40.53 TRINITY_DN1285_c1_g2_i2:136-513(+)
MEHLHQLEATDAAASNLPPPRAPISHNISFEDSNGNSVGSASNRNDSPSALRRKSSGGGAGAGDRQSSDHLPTAAASASASASATHSPKNSPADNSNNKDSAFGYASKKLASRAAKKLNKTKKEK